MSEVILNIYEVLGCLSIAIVAVVYIEILTEPGMVFGGYYDFLEKHYNKRRALVKVAGHCEFCLFGQVALWSYLIIQWSQYSWIKHIIFVSLTILFIHLIKNICRKVEK